MDTMSDALQQAKIDEKVSSEEHKADISQKIWEKLCSIEIGIQKLLEEEDDDPEEHVDELPTASSVGTKDESKAAVLGLLPTGSSRSDRLRRIHIQSEQYLRSRPDLTRSSTERKRPMADPLS